MLQYFRRTVMLLAILSGFTLPVLAQDGRVTGRIVDQTGAVLPGVTVDLVVQGTELTAHSDAQGLFRFDSVPSGPAELTFRLPNFSIARRTLASTTRGALPDVVLSLALNADVVVTGARTFRNIADVADPVASLIGIASAASQGAITGRQLEARPIMRSGEVLETVPGVVISQHSGEGKANQYYLRGFNLDHGSDFATTIAGTPANMPTHAHSQGYSDINFLIPELVAGVQYSKGPYFADQGDFATAEIGRAHV